MNKYSTNHNDYPTIKGDLNDDIVREYQSDGKHHLDDPGHVDVLTLVKIRGSLSGLHRR